MSEIELGHRDPHPSTLRKLAGALGVEVADFFKEPALPKAQPPPDSSGAAGSRAKGLEIALAFELGRMTEEWTRASETGDFGRDFCVRALADEEAGTARVEALLERPPAPEERETWAAFADALDRWSRAFWRLKKTAEDARVWPAESDQTKELQRRERTNRDKLAARTAS